LGRGCPLCGRKDSADSDSIEVRFDLTKSGSI
jgi:hypothetical protein